MIKNYILDTNVLLQDPNSIFNFEDNCVIIPIGVIEELDKFKKDVTELGRNARRVSRSLDDIRKKGDLREGASIGKHGIIKVRYNGNLKSLYKEKNIDLHVIHIAQETLKSEPETPCIIVSNDVNIRIRSNALGLQSESYESDKIDHDDLDVGYKEVVVPDDVFGAFVSMKEYIMEDIPGLEGLSPNFYVVLKRETDLKKSMLGRIDTSGKLVKKLIAPPAKFPLQPRNKEQSFLIDALLDRDIKLVSIGGKAGTGKTLISVACGHYQVETKKFYKRLLVSRPVFPMGRDIGYLPGDLSEKLNPWMQPIYDAFDILNPDEEHSGKDVVKKSKNVVVEPLTYIRGRSIHDQCLIIDESQNLTALEIKTIITRAGENTKVVLTGDIHQIDNPYIDSLSNGLSVVMTAFRGSQIATSIILDKGVRSELAEEAANKL